MAGRARQHRGVGCRNHRAGTWQPCTKAYLKLQAEIIGNWVELIEGFVKRGLTEEEALKEPLNVPALDSYAIGQRLFPINERLDGWNVSNIYKHVVARQQAA